MVAGGMFVPSSTLAITNSSVGKYIIEPYSYKTLITLDSFSYSHTNLVTAKAYTFRLLTQSAAAIRFL